MDATSAAKLTRPAILTVIAVLLPTVAVAIFAPGFYADTASAIASWYVHLFDITVGRLL